MNIVYFRYAMREIQLSFRVSSSYVSVQLFQLPVILYCLLGLVAHFACIIPGRGKVRADVRPSRVRVLNLDMYRVVQSLALLLISTSVVLLCMGQISVF